MSADTHAYSIHIVPSGRRVQVQEGQTILSAAIAAGVPLSYSCKNGMCGACRGRVIEGEVEQSDVEERYLSRAERDAGHVLLCTSLAHSDCTIEAQLGRETVFMPQSVPARIAAIDKLDADVAVVTLRLPMNRKLRFEAGQYVDVLLDGDERRSYSIASVPAPEGITEIELHIRRVPGGLFSDTVFDTLKVGAMLRLEAPLGTFTLREGTGPVVLMATGTGFAPLQSMVESELAKSDIGTRQFHVYWGGRDPRDLYRFERAFRWSEQHANVRFVPVISGDSPWAGRRGRVHEAVRADFPDMRALQVYACGSPAMVDDARQAFTVNGELPAQAFFADAFLDRSNRVDSIAFTH
jgi:CDP-4-dehydro-6-deoxyglucose reductase